ncbi:MDM4 protein, partial [Pitta sordida]|nr:MDM4 protein [Pitta sordida]
MTSPSPAQHPAPDSTCRTALGQANQVRPKVPLLKILQAAGAQGDTFTLKEVMHYLGQYIMLRQLYDKRQQHMVYCGGDELGELLGLESFSVKEPSPLYEMLRRNLTAAALTGKVFSFVLPAHLDAAQTPPQEQSVDKPSQDQLKVNPLPGGSEAGTMEGESQACALSTSEQNCDTCQDKDLLENLSKSKKPKLDLVFEEWDVAGLPWWFLGNLRSNYKSRSNGSTDIQTNQDMDTAIVSDTTDDLWFLNESPLDQSGAGLRVEGGDTQEGKEGDTKVPEGGCVDDLEDSQCLSDDTDTEAASEDCWKCSKCRKFNSPNKRYCYRCWALRKDWYSDWPRLAHSLSLSHIHAMKNHQRQEEEEEEEEGIDVPDCRRTMSAPAGPPSRLVTATKGRGDPVEPLALSQPSGSQGSLLREDGEEESLESMRALLSPCCVCLHRPRDGNIVHGRTAHLVACYRCARMLKKKKSPCPVCRKEIGMVIRIFMG